MAQDESPGCQASPALARFPAPCATAPTAALHAPIRTPPHETKIPAAPRHYSGALLSPRRETNAKVGDENRKDCAPPPRGFLRDSGTWSLLVDVHPPGTELSMPAVHGYVANLHRLFGNEFTFGVDHPADGGHFCQ